MTDERVWGLIGLCARCGQLTSGEQGCEGAVRAGKAALLLLDEAASANTRKNFTDTCTHYRVPLFTLAEGRLGQAIGKPGRMSAVISPGSLAAQLVVLLSPIPS